MSHHLETQWQGFHPGAWVREVDVRDFILKNYTPYEGDEGFLAGPTDATAQLWDQVCLLYTSDPEKLLRRSGAVNGGCFIIGLRQIF